MTIMMTTKRKGTERKACISEHDTSNKQIIFVNNIMNPIGIKERPPLMNIMMPTKMTGVYILVCTMRLTKMT